MSYSVPTPKEKHTFPSTSDQSDQPKGEEEVEVESGPEQVSEVEEPEGVPESVVVPEPDPESEKKPIIQVTPWLTYKRYSDGINIRARLVTVDGDKKVMEVAEKRGETLSCPYCRMTLGRLSHGAKIPNFFMEPPTFHERHKPVDK